MKGVSLKEKALHLRRCLRGFEQVLKDLRGTSRDGRLLGLESHLDRPTTQHRQLGQHVETVDEPERKVAHIIAAHITLGNVENIVVTAPRHNVLRRAGDARQLRRCLIRNLAPQRQVRLLLQPPILGEEHVVRDLQRHVRDARQPRGLEGNVELVERVSAAQLTSRVERHVDLCRCPGCNGAHSQRRRIDEFKRIGVKLDGKVRQRRASRVLKRHLHDRVAVGAAKRAGNLQPIASRCRDPCRHGLFVSRIPASVPTTTTTATTARDDGATTIARSCGPTAAARTRIDASCCVVTVTVTVCVAAATGHEKLPCIPRDGKLRK
eukprot:m.150060 g.150060  ORF g.150060 m.150060 type:complete len:322 (+) comp11679_c2_seq2:1745-2710(+)